jgi:diaminopimelate epimerase
VKSGLYKVEGAGNDFLLGIGRWADRLAGDRAFVRRLCDRRRGVGADGTLSLTAQTATSVSLVYVNADGSDGLFCGNGTRCAARAAVELLGCEPQVEIVTGWAVIPAEVRADEVSLVLPPIAVAPQDTGVELGVAVGEMKRLEVGVPHLVARVTKLAQLDLEVVAAPFRSHPAAGPEGANVNLYELDEEGRVAIRTWERGVEAETLSCGSGSVAVALVVMSEHGTTRVELRPASGDILIVEALGDPPLCPTRLSGPARFVGEIEPSEEFLGRS